MINFEPSFFLLVPDAPTSVKALVMSADSILVSWLPPDKPNGVITQYTVYYKEQGKADSEVSITIHTHLSTLTHCRNAINAFYSKSENLLLKHVDEP